MRGHSCPSNTYIESYGTSKFIDLTSRKGNPNGPQQGNGRNRRVTDREPSFRARSINRKDGTHHEEQLSSNGPSVILSSSPGTGTHASTPPLPAKKSGTWVSPPTTGKEGNSGIDQNDTHPPLPLSQPQSHPRPHPQPQHQSHPQSHPQPQHCLGARLGGGTDADQTLPLKQNRRGQR